MLTDTSLTDAVTASFDTDPRIPDSLEIAVAADEGIVTLRGTVESYNQLLAADEDANDVEGVAEVNNQLVVDPSGADRREDDEIRGAALQSLAWDVDVPEAVDVDVTDGWVTLTGDVNYSFQNDAAFDDVASLYGVLGVTNENMVENP